MKLNHTEREALDAQTSFESIPDIGTHAIRTSIHCVDGDPVVFVPTVEQLHWVYWKLWTGLADSNRLAIYRPDLHHAESVHSRSDELSRVIDELRWGPVHLICWSDAASIGLHLATHKPSQVRSLNLIGFPGRYNVFPGFRTLGNLATKRRLPSVPGREWATRLLVSGFLGDHTVRTRFIRPRMIVPVPMFHLARTSILPMMTYQPDMTRVVEQLDAKPTIVLATRDRTYRVTTALRWATSHGLEPCVIENAGHFAPFTHPTDILRTLALR